MDIQAGTSIVTAQKCCHFSYALEEVVHYGTHLETSSAFDIDLIERLFAKGDFGKGKIIVCNGFKRARSTLKKSLVSINKGFTMSFQSWIMRASLICWRPKRTYLSN